jgi:hypothetical protein
MTPSGGLLASASCIVSRIVICVNITDRIRCADIIIAAKQAEGWRLEQPEPGVLVWHTPAGRTYTTAPTQYAS